MMIRIDMNSVNHVNPENLSTINHGNAPSTTELHDGQD